MPAQHGNTDTLKRMQRGYCRDVRASFLSLFYNSLPFFLNPFPFIRLSRTCRPSLPPTLTHLSIHSFFPSISLFLSLSHILLDSVLLSFCLFLSHFLLLCAFSLSHFLSLSLTQAHEEVVRNARDIILGIAPKEQVQVCSLISLLAFTAKVKNTKREIYLHQKYVRIKNIFTSTSFATQCIT